MYPSYIIQLIWRITVPIYLKYKGVQVGKNLKCYGFPIVSKAPQSEIIIGDNVVLCSNSYFTALGVCHPVILRTLNQDAKLIIGNDVGISGASICAAVKIIIGDQVMLGANVVIMDTDFHAISVANRRYNTDVNTIKTKASIIEENVFVGVNSIILKGSIIGKNSIIGAGSIVSGEIPRDSVSAGNPAKIFRQQE